MAQGGVRPGAGRPKGSGKFKQNTKVIRVPDSMLGAVYRLIERGSCELPFYSSRVSAGFPSPADDHLERRLDLNEHLIKNPAATFFVEVTGDSMLDEGIHPRDILVVNRSLTPAHGKIAIVSLQGEFTVKKLHIEHGKLCALIPANASYEPIPIHDEDDVEIWGIVTHVIHAFRA